MRKFLFLKYVELQYWVKDEAIDIVENKYTVVPEEICEIPISDQKQLIEDHITSIVGYYKILRQHEEIMLYAHVIAQAKCLLSLCRLKKRILFNKEGMILLLKPLTLSVFLQTTFRIFRRLIRMR